MSVTRRTLLATPAAALAFAQSQSNNRVRTGVIGTGNRGSYLVTGILTQDVATVDALCDLKPDRLDKAASSAARHNPRTFKDWRQVIADKSIDAVFIATPPHLHAEMAVAAIRAGKHVYCEKPIGITAPQISQVLRAAKASKVVVTAGQQLRSRAQLIAGVKQIHDGLIGDVIMIKAQRHANADLPHDGSSGDWYFDVAKSGGYLIEQSVHNIDLCNWAAKGHPTKASGAGAISFYRNQPAGRTIFDNGSMTFIYPGGMNMSFTQNVFHPRSLPAAGQYVQIFGTKGAVDLMPVPVLHSLERGVDPRPLAADIKDSEHAHIEAFYNAILKGGPNPATVEVGATAALTAILGHTAMVRQGVANWSEFGIAL